MLRATDKEQKLARNYALDMQKQLQKIREGREEDDGGSSVRELKMIK